MVHGERPGGAGEGNNIAIAGMSTDYSDVDRTRVKVKSSTIH